MNKDNINISKIESYLFSILNNTVSSQTFVGRLPDILKSDWEDICLIDCGSAIADYDAFGSGIVLIWLYAKPYSDGSKNVARMTKLEQALNEVIVNSNNNVYHVTRRNTYTDYDTERKWHCNIVELNITIF